MNHITFSIISRFSVCIPFIVGFLCYKKVSRKYRPFYLFLCLITLTDLIGSFIVLNFTRSPGIYWIIFHLNPLAEAIVIAFLYKTWCVFRNNRILFKSIIIFYIVFWILIKVEFGFSPGPNNYFVLVSQIGNTILNLTLINKLIKNEKSYLHLNALFILCIGFIFYSSMGIIPNAFVLDFFKTSHVFRKNVLVISDASVTLAYLFFAYALILMTKEVTQKTSNFVLQSFTETQPQAPQKNLV